MRDKKENKWKKFNIALASISTITLLGNPIDIHNKSTQENIVQAQEKPDFEQLRKKWEENTFGNSKYDEKNSQMKSKFDKSEKHAEELLKTMQTQSTKSYLWNDAQNLKDSSANITKTYKKLEQISEVVSNPKSKLSTDDNKEKVKNAIKWMHEEVYGKNADSIIVELSENNKKSSGKNNQLNWWDYEIGATKSLVNIMILMNKSFTSEELKKYIEPIDKYLPSSKKIRHSVGQAEDARGGNLVDISKIKIAESILLENENMLKVSSDDFKSVFTYVGENASGKQRNGFYKDGSYIDHENIPYTGAYGVVLLDGISQVIPILNNTIYDLTEDERKILERWIDKSFMPLTYKGELMDLSRGRAISREKETSHVASATVTKSLLRLSEGQSRNKEKYEKIVKTAVKSDTSYSALDTLNSYSDISKMQELLNNDNITVNNRDSNLSVFNQMDRITYFNKNLDFAFGLSLSSKSIARYENINNENIKGWHTGEGMFYLYNSDIKHYRDNYWATVDKTKIPGTTNLKENEPKNEKKEKETEKTFVGGTKLNDNYATIGMDFENHDQKLSAQKSWFILGEKIVFVGSNINDKYSNNNSYTTIENRKSEGYDLLLDDVSMSNKSSGVVSSIFLKNKQTNRNIGYHFFENTHITTTDEEYTGKWKEINDRGSSDVKKDKYITVTQKHTNPNDTYAYVMYPGISQDDFKNKKDKVKLEKNDKDIQVVYDTENKVWGIVNYSNSEQTFSDNGTSIKIKAKGMYVLRKDGDKYTGSYYNPEETEEIKIEDKVTIDNHATTQTTAKSEEDPSTIFEIKKS